MTKTRRYTQRKRAADREETRLRIVEAAMALHEEIGPSDTTISAIAQRAGVQRLTVYRHFPDETAVFEACTSHWLELNPPPVPTAWEACEGDDERVYAALLAFYRYYRGTQRMWQGAHRDEPKVPAIQGPMAEFRAYLHGVGEEIGKSCAAGGDSRLTITLQHALAFTTWASLESLGLDDEAKADLALAWVQGLER
ncbi:TetR/AcrR family transcriptional regulator [Billgrantia ethanolica]|uniref:TetR/AcrR family transcriptional regulator n=1 Tax=Billgrantia ethanolica TaxID=2733486 RepID=A0ABS8ZYI9_9GAMM|nr:TetR/AcrR family transcriptional regulator [Halomonas ethanolica]MCE8001679.1 TetR/AcrR family transcriptional regulator [Halomonas ethanolica]